jgi:hypothetical protein
VGSCPCATIDDGTGYCRPQSNSCAVISCMLDLACPSTSTCDNPTPGTCGTCVSPGQPPVAQLTVCSPTQLVNDPACAQGASATASFNLANLTPDELTFSGVNSTDDHQVREYRFTMLPPLPAGATTSALANNGVRTTMSTVVLTLPPGVTGVFRIGLEVWDDAGQQSPTSSVISVSVFP